MSMNIIREVKDIKRFEEITLVLFEEGFEYLLGKTNLSRFIPFYKRLKSKFSEKKVIPNEVRLRKTLERLGPTFIKFGQMLSVRPDLVPKEYIKELEKLQDAVPQFSFDEVKQIVESELGMPLDKVFKVFNKEPIASASISQVHKATLKNGKVVAVKVQRPNTKKIIECDIELMQYFARLLENHFPNTKKYQPSKIVYEFADWTTKEIDFRVEARNAKRFYNNFKNSKTVKIPKVYDEYTTSKVIVMEYIEGIELNKIGQTKDKKPNFKKIIKNGFDAILTQVFVHGFFHGDPHPGNILITNKETIAFIDFGIVGHFDDKLKQESINLMYSIITVDNDMVVESLLQMSGKQKEDVNFDTLSSDIKMIIEPLQNADLKEIKISEVLEELFDIAIEYKLNLPIEFILFGKTIVTLEGICLKYDPEIKIIDYILPFADKLIKSRSNPIQIAKNIKKKIINLKNFIEKFPEQASGALEKISKGSIKIDIEDTDINKLALEIDRSSNRLAYGIIIASFVIAGALLMSITNNIYTIFGINIVSVILFGFAGFIGLILFISILGERRLR